MLAGGAIAYFLHVVMRSMLTAGVDPVDSAQSTLWVPVNALGAVGATLVLLSLPAMYRRLAGRDSARGLIGFGLLATSWTFFGVFLGLYGAIVMPWLANQAPELLAVRRPPPPRSPSPSRSACWHVLAGTVLPRFPSSTKNRVLAGSASCCLARHSGFLSAHS